MISRKIIKTIKHFLIFSFLFLFHDLILKELLKFILCCELHSNRHFLLEQQIIFLFMRTINIQYRDMTVDIDFKDDFQLNSIFEYLYSMYRLLYRRR